VDFISFVEEKVGKIAAVLACDACDKGFFHNFFCLVRFVLGVRV
jgi:hypothetical protein